MDNFALLGQSRLPWIDPDSLKAAFLEISARTHPDRVAAATGPEREAATKHFAELNAAYNCLRDPKQRLLHLLELESGAPPANVQDIPPGTMELFVEVGQNCRQADAIVAGKAGPASPLLQAQWFEKGMACAEKLGALQQRIHLRRDELLAELRDMNAAWIAAPPSESPDRAGALPLRRLEEIGREMSYISRWSGQIHERIAQLSF
ncbi:MAG TPA: DnaJ domain-containing protein [Candidatus Baltobacteraceae bacterium]|jgi:curved DNA-binding protein CbpA|nr:DnaJ domain-containing protein [Candidatus Baltobacteraceae bacterium]